jgi:hypothetical protein
MPHLVKERLLKTFVIITVITVLKCKIDCLKETLVDFWPALSPCFGISGVRRCWNVQKISFYVVLKPTTFSKLTTFFLQSFLMNALLTIFNHRKSSLENNKLNQIKQGKFYEGHPALCHSVILNFANDFHDFEKWKGVRKAYKKEHLWTNWKVLHQKFQI